MKKFLGINILEVWDFRISTGSPILYADGEFWGAVVYANDPGDQERVILEEHVTDVKTTGNPHDPEGVAACYKWLHSVRDKFSRDHIEERKPIARLINESNAVAVQINNEATLAQREGDSRRFNEKTGELQNHLKTANAAIKKATAAFHAQVNAGGAA